MQPNTQESIERLERQFQAMRAELAGSRLKLRLLGALASTVVVACTFVVTGKAPAIAQSGNGIAQRVTLLEQKVAVLQSANGSLQAALNAEMAARQAGDTGLQNAIGHEAAERGDADHTIMIELAAERDARMAGDAALHTAVDNEVSGRGIADHEIMVQLAAERDARMAGDTLLQSAINDLVNKTQYISVADGQMVISGTNLWIQNGMGQTDSTNSLGNLILGYNESRGGNDLRTGSHNLVIGTGNNYTSYGGAVIGRMNDITGPMAFAMGLLNVASAENAGVFGGNQNHAGASWTVVSGGSGNRAEVSDLACVFGGSINQASGRYGAVFGGTYNQATGWFGAVCGGGGNFAAGTMSTVTGGQSVTESVSHGWSAGSLGGTTYTGRFRSH